MENLYAKIGQRISIMRKKSRLTQEQLSEILDITVKHVSAVERGKSSLSLEKMIELCDYFDCTLDYLILGRNLTHIETHIPKSVLDIFGSDDDMEKSLFTDYLALYSRLRSRT